MHEISFCTHERATDDVSGLVICLKFTRKAIVSNDVDCRVGIQVSIKFQHLLFVMEGGKASIGKILGIVHVV